jgi:hypothetical protein
MGGISADSRMEELSGHHTRAALSRIGSITSVDGTVAQNPSEVMESLTHSIKRRDDILPTRQASNFGAQMLGRAKIDTTGASINDHELYDQDTAPESKWMLKVRSLLVLGETTDFQDSANGSVNGDSGGFNVVDKFQDLADSALIDKSGKDRLHLVPKKPTSPELKKSRSDKKVDNTRSSTPTGGART